MTALSRFAAPLGLPAHQAEDALHSERAAHHVLSRRTFFGVSAAMAAGTAFSIAKPEEPRRRIFGREYSFSDIQVRIGDHDILRGITELHIKAAHELGVQARRWADDMLLYGFAAAKTTYEGVVRIDPRQLPASIWEQQ